MTRKFSVLLCTALGLVILIYSCTKSSQEDLLAPTSEQKTSPVATDRSEQPPRNMNVPPIIQLLEKMGQSNVTLPEPLMNLNCMGTLTINATVPVEGFCYTLDIYSAGLCVLTDQQFLSAFPQNVRRVGLFQQPGTTPDPNYVNLPLNTPIQIPINSNERLWFLAAIYPTGGTACNPAGCCADIPPDGTSLSFSITNGGSQINNYVVEDGFIRFLEGLNPVVGPHRIICANTPLREQQECASSLPPTPH